MKSINQKNPLPTDAVLKKCFIQPGCNPKVHKEPIVVTAMKTTKKSNGRRGMSLRAVRSFK